MKRIPALTAGLLLALLLWGLTIPVSGTFQPGPLLDPWDGLYRTAREAVPHASEDLFIEGMDAPVRVEMDDRGVPHLFAESDKDATMALGYVVARDRLFEMEFIWRVGTGRLAEVLGPAAMPQDRFFRDIGMVRTVREQAVATDASDAISSQSAKWYTSGANAWVRSLDPASDPFEYRVLGFRPSLVTTEYMQSLFAFMTYDLSFRRSDVGYETLRRRLGPDMYDVLYPEYSGHESYIVQDDAASPVSVGMGSGTNTVSDTASDTAGWLTHSSPTLAGSVAEGFLEGKGSNNWAVNGHRSATGMPILAGDMHLNLSLPAIWYEVHMVTPDMNVYGVTFPSTPAIVEGITEDYAWAFTNTGADQIDRYAMSLNDAGTAYLYDGAYRDLEMWTDTIRVRGGEDVVQTVPWSHLGPVSIGADAAVATQWVLFEEGRTLDALWMMNRARDHKGFEDATRSWDYPMQNILYAGRDSIISIRSAGYLPVRGEGDASGILDGTTSATAWSGRVPFDELPSWTNPDRGYLTSTNQRPAGRSYPYYLGRDWESIHRSQRIDTLLNGANSHGVDDLKAFQADVHAVQADYLIPVLDTLSHVSGNAAALVDMLRSWDRRMDVDSREATVFAALMDTVMSLVWDEPAFAGVPEPSFVRLFDAATSAPEWFDVAGTERMETFADVLRMALDRLPDSQSTRVWGDVHTLTMKHITRSEALRPLWREQLQYPGWKQTLSPARGLPATGSASWRVVVDLSTSPPTAWGVYPGGQSGNPFSAQYDAHIDTFTSFGYFPLSLARSPSTLRATIQKHDQN